MARSHLKSTSEPVPFVPKDAEPQDTQPAVVKPHAPRARLRLRHIAVAMSYCLGVVLPAALAALYLWTRSADQFVSHMGFTIRSEEAGSAIELLGGITEISGASSSDTDVLYAYLGSREIVQRVDALVNLRQLWSENVYQHDPLFAFDPSGTLEDLHRYWLRNVKVIYDSGTGVIELRVHAFAPQDAQQIAAAALDESTRMINALSRAARDDAQRYARDELDIAETRLKHARSVLTAFRNQMQIVDPTIDTQNQMGVIVTLQQQLADALIQRDILAQTTYNRDQRLLQANQRVDIIRNRIAEERRALGFGSDGGNQPAFAHVIGEYEALQADKEFAEKAYSAALISYNAAQAETRKQSRYLATHMRPTLPERAEHPKRWQLLILFILALTLTWIVLALSVYSLKDRR